MTTYTFEAEALTPVHIGAGQEIDPCEFVLKDGSLMRFNPAQVFNDLDEAARKTFEALSEKADLKALQGFFREYAIPERYALAWVDASREFVNQFEKNVEDPNNSFLVQMMPRNPQTGHVCLPGSSLKGAIRTAVVNHFTNLVPSLKGTVHVAVKQAHPKDRGKVLEQKALDRTVTRNDGRERDEIDRDVFRLIDVEDTVLPSGLTMISRAINWNPHKAGSEQIQMWFERVKSRADGETQRFQVKLHVDDNAMNHPAMRRKLGRTIDLKTIVDASNSFYWGRLAAELDKFFQGNTDPTRQAVYRTMAVQDSKGRHIVQEPVYPQMLIRVGRFSHFESLSVDELREGWNAQRNRPIDGMGATRTLCHMGDGKPSLPFGWVLLTLSS
ncbi:MAG: type III-A CRISPR-associated RAMP protein Csm5 [Thermodesulfobacteriota bacterium]